MAEKVAVNWFDGKLDVFVNYQGFVMKNIALLLAALTITACSSTQVPYDPALVTEKRAPVVSVDAPNYEWDENKSFALNVAHLDGEKVGLRDTESPEDAQQDVSGAYRVGNFLINTWAGTATQAAAHDRVVAARQDSYKFDPYAIVFIDKYKAEEVANNGGEAAFEMVLDVLRTELTKPISEKYDDASVEVLAWNQATKDQLTENHSVRWPQDTDFVIVLRGEACEVAKDNRALSVSSKFPYHEVYKAYTMTGYAPPGDCRVFGNVRSVATTRLPGNSEHSVAFRITLNNNYYTPTIALNGGLTWVFSTEWQDGMVTQKVAAPFVTYDGEAWLFTHSNDRFPLSDIR